MAGITSEGVSLSANAEAIANVTSMSGPGMTAGQIDTTALDTTGGFRTFIGGFRDGGEITLDLNYDSTETSHQEDTGGLKRYFNEGGAETWTLTLSDSSVFSFDGIVTGLDGPNHGVDEVVTMSVTIKVSGDVTFPS